jgi:hypothetical protein
MGTNDKGKGKAKSKPAILDDELLDSHVSKSQCGLAVASLLKHSLAIQKRRDETELLGASEENVWLVVATKRMQPERKLKPFRMCVCPLCATNANLELMMRL